MATTISQALRKIRKLKGQMDTLKKRAINAVSYEAGKEPAYKFSASVEEMSAVRAELIQLQSALALTNASTKFDYQGQTLTLTMATRILDEYKAQIAWLQTLPVKAQPTTVETRRDFDGDKYVSVNVTWTCALPEVAQQEKIKELQDKFDLLNNQVETLNHEQVLIGL